MSEEQEIREGTRMQEFLADPIVQGAFKRVEEKMYAEFKDTQDPAVVQSIWARARALDDLKLELAVVVDRGKVATAQKQRRERSTR